MLQLPTGGDAPYLIAFAAVYGLIEVSKMWAQRRNHAVPQLIELLKEQNKTAVATLERIERKVGRDH